MPTVNEDLADALIRHQTYIQRYGGSTVNKTIALLNRADADLIDQIRKRLQKLVESGFDTGPETTKRLQDLLSQIRTMNKSAYDSFGKELTENLKALAAYEIQWQVGALGDVLPAVVSFTTPPARLVIAAVNSRPFQGKLLGEVLNGLEATRAARIRDAIRIGIVEGQTTDQIITRLRGTKAAGYADGLMEIDRRAASSVVRTATNHVSNAAKEALYADNADLLNGVAWHATLDGRTCPSCAALDGKKYEVGKGPRPPLHFGCRCTTVPVVKSWRQLGIDIDEMPESTRASMNGQVPASLTYGDWLKKQPAAFQDETLGATRGALFRRGDLSLDRFVDRAGNELNLSQLRAKESAAFNKAGLAA